MSLLFFLCRLLKNMIIWHVTEFYLKPLKMESEANDLKCPKLMTGGIGDVSFRI